MASLFEQEHRAFFLRLQRLHVLAAADPGVLPGRRLAVLIGHEAEGVLHSAGIQFGVEETGGYMTEVVDDRPDLITHINEALRDHAEIRELLVRLADGSDRDIRALQAEARVVVRLIQAHQRREIDILQEADLGDLRGGN